VLLANRLSIIPLHLQRFSFTVKIKVGVDGKSLSEKRPFGQKGQKILDPHLMQRLHMQV